VSLFDIINKLIFFFITWIISFTAVKVSPRSIDHSSGFGCSADAKPMAISSSKLEADKTLDITYSYSIKFVVSNENLTNLFGLAFPKYWSES
jgi:hypothetical protein